MANHTYFLVNPKYEHERYLSILNAIKGQKILNYTIFTHTWGCDITESMRSTLVKSDTSMRYHGRTMDKHPMTNGEISLFLNHIECLKSIRDSFDSGIFLLFESDVLFNDNFESNINKVIEMSQECEWAIINIGDGNSVDLPKSRHIANSLELYKEKRNRCTEAILWNYKGIVKFLDYYEKTCDIDGPIDTKMDVFSEFVGGFDIYWAHPPLVYQGSVRNVFRSLLR